MPPRTTGYEIGLKDGTTRVVRRSLLTRQLNEMILPCGIWSIMHWINQGTLIQDALPRLDVYQRSFLLDGITKEEWERFGSSKSLPVTPTGGQEEDQSRLIKKGGV